MFRCSFSSFVLVLVLGPVVHQIIEDDEDEPKIIRGPGSAA